VGVCEVRLDGAATNEIAFSGDTKNAGTNTTIDTVQLTMNWGSSGPYGGLADWYICDANGTTNNHWLGDVTVRNIKPSANGTYSQLTNSAGNQTNNYTYVDEIPASSTDYVGAYTSGLKDTYRMADLPSGIATVMGVQVNTTTRKSDANLAQVKTKFIVNGTEYTGTARALSTSSQELSELREINPNTSQLWTVGDINSIESGIEIG
jgi:hypothetical protein